MNTEKQNNFDYFKMLSDIRQQQLQHSAGFGSIAEKLSQFTLDKETAGIYQHIFLVDENKKSIVVVDFENDKQYVIPFGLEVCQIVNTMVACRAGSTASEQLENADFSNDEKEELNNFYNDNKPYLDIMYQFLLNLSSYNINQKISFFNDFQFFNFNEWFLASEKLAGSSIYGNAKTLLHLICEHGVVKKYESWTFANEEYTGWAYHCTNSEYLFALDLYQIVINGHGSNLKKCERCDRLYIATHGKNKYCPYCKSNYGKIRTETRKKNRARYLHKRVQDKLRQQGANTNDFINESNYYWDIVRKKEVAPDPKYLKSIKTESQYIAWLEKKLKQ